MIVLLGFGMGCQFSYRIINGANSTADQQQRNRSIPFFMEHEMRVRLWHSLARIHYAYIVIPANVEFSEVTSY